MVTVPPLPWISAAHVNGVRILGTFITESDNGRQTCEWFLETTERAEAVADRLVLLACHYGFEGLFGLLLRLAVMYCWSIPAD